MPARDLARSAQENLPSDADFNPCIITASPAPASTLADDAHAVHAHSGDAEFTPASLHDIAAFPAPAFAPADYAHAAHAHPIDAEVNLASLHDNCIACACPDSCR